MRYLKNRLQILLSFFFLFNMTATSAQENVYGKYKAGDRVLCDPSYTGEFKQGTVVKVEGAGDALTCCRYRVKIDNDDPLWNEGRLLHEANMKPAGAVTKPNEKDQNQTTFEHDETKKDATEDFNDLAYRKIIDCPIQQKQLKANSAPDVALLKRIIQCLYERKAPQGMTGAKTMDITSFQLGTSRKWVPKSDIGSGNLNTNVHAVKVSWTEKTYYETYTQQIDNISIFNCYVNAVGEWECGLGQRIYQSEIKRIERKESP